MGEVVRLDDYRPTPHGSGAREALAATIVKIPHVTWLVGIVALADFILLSLWALGFEIVPHGPPDDAA